jgi:hypothetical protein
VQVLGGRSCFRAPSPQEARLERNDASRRPAYAWIPGYWPGLVAGLLRVYASLHVHRLRFLTGLLLHPYTVGQPTTPHTPLHIPQAQPHSPIHPPLLWQTTHHPYQALHSLSPPSKLPRPTSHQPHPQPPAVAWIRAYGELTPPLLRIARPTGHHQARL